MSENFSNQEISSNHVSTSGTFRDELNFAEFPLASLAKQIDPNQKTLSFTDEVWDRSKNAAVKRTLTISASSDHGLPMPLDDEVILGLMQLSSKDDFANRSVKFSRRKLLQILGWRLDTKNFARIEESLLRWLGVTLHYEKAWWNKEKQSWVDESFHILDRVTIYDRERQIENIKAGEDSESSFTWNEVVFNSFKSGNLKKLDFEFFKSLESSISKRIYRFLDKRFYQKSNWEFDLNTFAFEHVGLSKKYHSGELKRVLRAPLQELERAGFIKEMTDLERYQKVVRGVYKIVFVAGSLKGQAAKISFDDASKKESGAGDKKEPCDSVIMRLAAFGVSGGVSRQLVEKFDDALIVEKLDYVEELVVKGDAKVSKNPAGFLVKAIKENYPTAKAIDNTKRDSLLQAKRWEEDLKKKQEQEEQALRDAEEAQKEEGILAQKYYLKSDEERLEILEQAIKNCKNSFLARQARGEGRVAESARRQILLEWVGDEN